MRSPEPIAARKTRKPQSLFRTDGIEFDPATNPGVLDTLTWDTGAALGAVFAKSAPTEAIARTVGRMGFESDAETAARALAVFANGDFRLVPSSCAVKKDGQVYILAVLPDRQRVILNIFDPAKESRCVLPIIGEATYRANGESKAGVRVCPADLSSVARFVKSLAPQYAPKPLGTKPRLGIGNRQTAAVWPGIIRAISELRLPSEIIQNSAYRELAPKSFILSPPGSEAAYLPGHGSLSIGHTGTSIEGLWLNGVVGVIEAGYTGGYGADLDHIPVKSFDDAGMAKAKSLIRAGRHYTFFTLDTSALFDLSALRFSGERLAEAFREAIPAEEDRRDLLAHYKASRKPNLPKTEDEILRVAAAYGKSVVAACELFEYIKSLKRGGAFDFEFSLDEGPDITTPMETAFCLEELERRGVTVHFVAPNVGFEKRVDYRKPDGLPGLEERVREMSRIAGEYGALLDFHSGSDKAPETYRTISRAANGRVKLKVSGKLQIMLAEVLAELQPGFFDWWWDWTLDTARGEAANGSAVAEEYARKVEERMRKEGGGVKRLPSDQFFTDFCFSAVGAKDERGNFLFRERFYTIPKRVLDEYTRRVVAYIKDLAADLGLA